MSSLQQSVVLVKPDALQRGLVGEIVSRFERKGLKLAAIKMLILSDEILDQWYAHHKEKPFFGNLKKFMQSAPVIAMVWEGLEAIGTVRKLCGVTTGYEAEAGSIRGDLSLSGQHNIIHASDSVKAAEKEKQLIFDADELFDYDKGEYLWVYSVEERE
ncbi:nucleoside-diphosphate kinase [Patescibacteria group bacterium]|nr:nucleoside-diphosphate kinase [Patescibacteria group bacterium]MBU1931822.1 nucleoside-diphosphate kinase [Patescibacteria group bacterium]